MYKIKFLRIFFIIIVNFIIIINFINNTYANQINSQSDLQIPATQSIQSDSPNSTQLQSPNDAQTSNKQENETTTTQLNLYSKSSILIDSATGQILYEHNAYEQLYPASTTKLMTAILTLENCQLTDTVTIEKSSLSGIPPTYTTAALQPGETLTVDQLLHVLLIPSANDAANVLACHIAGSIDDFAIMMNAKAKEIGCKNTHFVNPSGIHNDNHYSTAYDMALIGQYANTFDTIKEIATQTQYALPNLPNGTERKFKTTNTLITPSNKYFYEYATGLKTGYTEKAKSCIVAKAKKDNVELICAVLYGDKTEDKKNERELDCHTLFDYGFNNFKPTEICTQNTPIDKTTINDIPQQYQDVNIIYSDTLNLLVNTNNTSNTITNISWNTDLNYPINKNTIVGNITYIIDDNTYSVNLLAGEDIFPKMQSKQISYIFYILVGILIILLLITIFTNHYHKKKKSSKDEKYFRHSFY